MKDTIDQLTSAGLIIDGALEFGKLTRCKVEGDIGTKRSGWYVLYNLRLSSGIDVVVGAYGNWKRFGDEVLKIEIDAPELSDEDRRQYQQQQQALREKAAKEKQARAKEAASRALQIWADLPESGSSDYLVNKKVGAYGVRFGRGSIVVPVANAQGMVGLQFIDAQGGKKFLTGTAKRGAWHLIGDVGEGDRIWIAEGYATAATVYKAVGEPVAVAFDAGNLKPVAEALYALYPDKLICIAADDDAGTAGNPGVTKAAAAAAAVGGRYVVPDFGGAQA